MRLHLVLSIALLGSIGLAAAEDIKPLPREAQQVVDQMDADILKIRQDALRKLDKIIGDITKTGNLELAMAVKAKETDIQGLMPKPEMLGLAASIVGRWSDGGALREFKENGLFVHHTGKLGKWTIESGKLVIKWDGSDLIETMFLPVRNNSMSGSNNKGNSFTLIKVPEGK